MHTKLVPQLVAAKGSYTAIVVDFYWVGEFTKAGWLQPLDERINKDGVDTSVYVPPMRDLVMAGRRRHLHAAVLQLRDGHALPEGPARGPSQQGRLQGQVRHGPRGAEDLGRISEAGRVLHQGRQLRRRQPGPAPRPDRHGVVELPVRQRLGIPHRRLEADAQQPGRHRRDRAIRAEHQQVRPGRLGGVLVRRSLQRDGAGQGLLLHHLQFLPPQDRRSEGLASRRQGRDHAGAGPGGRQGRLAQRRLGLGDPEVEPQCRTPPGSSSSGWNRRTSR